MQQELKPKQQRFCEEYVIDLNATQAAIRAGYSENTAIAQASRLLANVNISAYITELQDKMREKIGITAENVINELAKIGFSNIQDFVNGGNSILELKHLDRDKVAAVSGIETEVTEFNGVITTKTKLKFHSKVAALNDLGKHLGIFDKDNKQKAPVINIEALTPDQLNKILVAQKAING